MTFLTVVLAAALLLPFLGGALLVRVLDILVPLYLLLWFLLHGRRSCRAAACWDRRRAFPFWRRCCRCLREKHL